VASWPPAASTQYTMLDGLAKVTPQMMGEDSSSTESFWSIFKESPELALVIVAVGFHLQVKRKIRLFETTE
jgi:hypothetical protein